MNQKKKKPEKRLSGSLEGFEFNDLLEYFDLSGEDEYEDDGQTGLAELTPIKPSDTSRLDFEV